MSFAGHPHAGFGPAVGSVAGVGFGPSTTLTLVGAVKHPTIVGLWEANRTEAELHTHGTSIDVLVE